MRSGRLKVGAGKVSAGFVCIFFACAVAIWAGAQGANSKESSSTTASSAATPKEMLLGRELFNGKAPLKGRMSTHLTDLPSEVVRCSNCHASQNGPAVPQSAAPRLTRQLLLVPQARRGGPRSRYDRDKFCALLRKGIDPAYVVINVQMPRYTVDEAECSALWRFLTEDPHE